MRLMVMMATGMVAGALGCHPALAGGVLVFGGTGQLGAPHVSMLAERGETVVVFHRPTSSFERLDGTEFSKFEGNLLDADSVLAAMRKVKPRVVIDTSARRGYHRQNPEPFYTPAMKNIVAAAQATGVRQIIIHSSIGVRESEAAVAAYLMRLYGFDVYSTEYPPDMPVNMRFNLDNNPNLLDKAGAEVVLEQSGIDYTIVRNGLLEFEPAAPTGRGELLEDETTFGRITRTDLARISLACLDNKSCFGKIYHAIDTGLAEPRPGPAGAD
jgi:uncharacterized protein YbjT (DUF2867 family)